MRSQHVFFGIMAAVVLLGSTANAGFTPVASPIYSGEVDHATILEAYYSPGSTWASFGTRTDGAGQSVDYANGSLTATRVSDFGLGGILNPAATALPAADDALWTGTAYELRAVARYASYTQEFGYDLSGDGLGYVKLFDVSGWGTAVSGSATLALNSGDTLTWNRAGTGNLFSSRPGDNLDELDHMVSYRISGLGDGRNHFVLFWEDLPCGGDHDYNDLVVEAVAVPEPGTLVALLAAVPLCLFGRRGR